LIVNAHNILTYEFLCPFNLLGTMNKLSLPLTKPPILSIFLAEHQLCIYCTSTIPLEVLYIFKATNKGKWFRKKKRKVGKRSRFCRYCARSIIGTGTSIIGSPNSYSDSIDSQIGRGHQSAKEEKKICPYLSDD